MFRVLSVSYDLRTRERPDYSGLERELKRSHRWWHYLKSTWLIQTEESADELWERIAPHIHRDDRVLIIEVRDNSQGWLPREAWAWVRANVPAPVA
jgi:hypothetical protein